MNFKFIEIKGCETCSQVLVARVRPEEDPEGYNDFVEIVAWHTKEESDYYQRETVEFDDFTLLRRFICDFSEASANEFANNFWK